MIHKDNNKIDNKIDNNNKNIIDNNYTNNNDNDKLFFSVWRNIYLKLNILNHLNIYKDNNHKTFKSKDSLITYQYKSYITNLTIDFNEELTNGCIENSVNTLVFKDKYNYPLSNKIIPSSVTTIVLGKQYNIPLLSNSLPLSVTALALSKCYNHPLLDQSNGGSLINLINLKTIIFGRDFSYPLINLPEGLETIHMGYGFNQPLVEFGIPKSVKKLSLGWNFNHSLRPLNTSSIQKLTINNNFDQPIVPGDLPSSLTKITINSLCDEPFSKHSIPYGVKYIKFEYISNITISPDIIPSSVVKLKLPHGFNTALNNLPASITKLVARDFNQTIYSHQIPSVKTLKLGNNYNTEIVPGSLPQSLTKLKLGSWFNKKLLPSSLPSSITSITFSKYFDQTLEAGVLPISLTSLILGDYYNQPILKDQLPQNLLILIFGKRFNQRLIYLPNSITTLSLGKGFTHQLETQLPNSLTSLKFPTDYEKIINYNFVPKSIKSIKFSNY